MRFLVIIFSLTFGLLAKAFADAGQCVKYDVEIQQHILVSIFQQETKTNSPDGKFSLTIETKEESDSQVRYISMLTDNTSGDIIEIANCVRKDLSAPNFYWDKNSKYLIYELCSESFSESRIKILNLETNQTEAVLTGLIGNHDKSQQQFDPDNEILIYFDTSIDLKNDRIPNLCAFDQKAGKTKKLFEFGTTMNMEFPQIIRMKDKRKLLVKYTNPTLNQRLIGTVDY